MKLEGEIGEINLTELLVELWRERFTGAIRFENDGIIKIIYFKGGDVLSASTNDRSDSIDEILMRANKVTREHVKQALAKRKESETLGDALLNLGFITRKELTWARRVQVIGVFRSIIEWKHGTYTVVADYLPKREEGTLFSLPQLIVEMIVTEQDRSRFERALEGGSIVYAKGAEFDEVFSRLGLNDEAEQIGRAIDGQRNASEVATASGQDGFNTYKLLNALAVLGLLQRVEPGNAAASVAVAPADDFGLDAGVASDAADAWGDYSPSTPAATEEWAVGDAPAIDPSYPDLGDSGVDVSVPPAFEPAPSSFAPSTPSYTEPSFATADEDELSVSPEPAPSAMPAWDVAPRGATPVVAPPAEPPADADEVKWGFDEAQIETARRASVPMSSSERVTPYVEQEEPPRRKTGLIAAILALVVLAGAGYAGWNWWQGRQEAEATAAAVPVRPRPRLTQPAETGTVTPVADTAATTMTTNAAPTATVAQTTAAPVTAPAVLPPPSAAPTATVAATAPAPKPVAQTPARPVEQPKPAAASTATSDRYQAIARDYEQNANGTYAVQFGILCEVANLEKAVREGGKSVWFVPISIKGRSCYRVFWGRYGSEGEAQRGIGELPARLREGKPVVVRVPKG